MTNIDTIFILIKWKSSRIKKLVDLILKTKLLIRETWLIETLTMSFNRCLLINSDLAALKHSALQMP